MKYLLYYKLDSNFIADQTSVGGDGTKVVSVVDGVAWTNDQEKAYYRLANNDSENLTSYTITIHYVDIFNNVIAPDKTNVVDVYAGKSADELLSPVSISRYTAIDEPKKIVISGNTEYTFKYIEEGTDFKDIPLTFLIVSSGTIYWGASKSSSKKEIQYKKNNGDWLSITSNTGASAPSISVSDGDVVQFRGDNTTYSFNDSSYSFFSGSTVKFNVVGNIMSLINSTGFTTTDRLSSEYTFNSLFYDCTGLTSAENLILPVTGLTRYCYTGMFYNCSSLTTVPALPATTLADYCYRSMFEGCTSLTSTPALPATTLANQCYSYMFAGCTSLTSAPVLPATTLADSCYYGMFQGCTSLTTAPELPATTLAEYCYAWMFYKCTSLTIVPALPATTLVNYCYQRMFQGCTSLRIAPSLPATTLKDGCYRYMFSGCTSLNYIKCLAINISASNCTGSWVTGVAATGTFVKPASMTSWTTGVNGIPSGWTRQDA